MGLEIELEYDDTQDGVWAGADEPELRERLGRRWSRRPTAAGPLLVQVGIALAALVLGAASTAGFLDGRQAQQNRAAARLHLAPVNPLVVQAIKQLNAVPLAELLATPWTDVFDQDVSLTLVNDGSDPITVLGATLVAPEFRSTALTPASRAQIPPGGVSVLRGKAHFVCADFPAPAPGVQITASPKLSTLADISVRTADGHTGRESLVVDRYSDVAEQAVCQRMLAPEVVTGTKFTPSSGAPGAYTATVSVANRAPYPLRVTMPSSSVQDWLTGAGLNLQAPGPAMIPAHGSGTVTIPVSVASCGPAMEMAQQGYFFDALVFANGLKDPGSLDSREIHETLSLADADVIKPFCNRSSPTVGSGSGH